MVDGTSALQHRLGMRTLKIVGSLALVAAVFFYALPKFADFSQVWVEIRAMTLIETASLVAAAAWNIVTYWFVMMSSLPGSNIWQTMKINQASTAVANTLPGGGAIGIAVTFGMYSGYGFSNEKISLSVLLSGIWNNFVKLGMPIVALALLAIQGNVGSSLLVAAVVGVLVLIGAIGLFAAILSSERMARAIGVRMERVVNWFRKLFRKKA